MRIVRNFLLGAIAALGLALPALAAERAIIVLDGSGSMWAQIDGKARITIARETLHEVLSTLPDDLELGFMTYGHREKGNCSDIEMLVEPATGTGAAIAAAADKINPKGMTPISDAVRLAAEDLRFTEQKATVILITDGLETCEVDPCALASDLEAQGIDFTTHVLGFGLSDDEGQQVACLAENTGGKYLSANDGNALVEALTTTVAQVVQAEPEPVPEPEPEPEPVADYNYKPTASLSEGGPDLTSDYGDLVWEWYKPAADGSQGEYVGTDYNSDFEGALEPGDYIMTAKVGYAIASQPVTIEAGKIATPHFVLNGTILKLHPLPSEGADVDENAAVEIRHAGDYVTTNYGDTNLVVPAGALEVDVSIGEATVTRSYDAVAGETIDEDVIVGVGRAEIASFYVEGMPASDDIFIEIFGAAKAIDGSRKSVTYNYGSDVSFELPEGDYVAVYRLRGAEGEAPFSIKTAELTEVPLVLDAGILAVTTPGDNYVEVFGAAKSIDGSRKSFDYGYGPEFQTTLPDGDYVVFTRIGDGESETPITIKGGERFELTVEAAAAGKSK
ncbi:vWA domain-containing protein [Devosia ginsengisoli]|uniref:VWA domain-containing protein n=1 Tax=Devosia ginsengisoli TaxID=400770 RepID=A0A5B8LR86_9HYPH|nr:VWA domain-containing protein [Devosia ginsengisoli]QDZ10758.1 VWA domain-containing protein [Devosia ginsengisoli]